MIGKVGYSYSYELLKHIEKVGNTINKGGCPMDFMLSDSFHLHSPRQADIRSDGSDYTDNCCLYDHCI